MPKVRWPVSNSRAAPLETQFHTVVAGTVNQTHGDKSLPSMPKGRGLSSGYSSLPASQKCLQALHYTYGEGLGGLHYPTAKREKMPRTCQISKAPPLIPDSRKKGHFRPRLPGIWETPLV